MDIANKNSFLVRAIVILVAAVAPFIYTHYQQDEVSISEFWGTGLEPLFIFTNAATSYFFFSTEKWKPSAILLLLLTAFSVDKFAIAHNVFAASFFIYNFIPLATDKRLNIYAVPYTATLAFVQWPDIFVTEVLAVLVLCVFHAHLLWIKWSVVKRRHNKTYQK